MASEAPNIMSSYGNIPGRRMNRWKECSLHMSYYLGGNPFQEVPKLTSHSISLAKTLAARQAGTESLWLLSLCSGRQVKMSWDWLVAEQATVPSTLPLSVLLLLTLGSSVYCLFSRAGALWEQRLVPRDTVERLLGVWHLGLLPEFKSWLYSCGITWVVLKIKGVWAPLAET